VFLRRPALAGSELGAFGWGRLGLGQAPAGAGGAEGWGVGSGWLFVGGTRGGGGEGGEWSFRLGRFLKAAVKKGAASRSSRPLGGDSTGTRPIIGRARRPALTAGDAPSALAGIPRGGPPPPRSQEKHLRIPVRRCFLSQSHHKKGKGAKPRKTGHSIVAGSGDLPPSQPGRAGRRGVPVRPLQDQWPAGDVSSGVGWWRLLGRSGPGAGGKGSRVRRALFARPPFP